MSTADDLIILLRAIEAASDIESLEEDEDTVINWGYIEDRHQLIQDAVWLANELLVKPEGHRDVENESKIREAGFYISCLEKDGFGWLTGGVHTSKGIIAYG